MFEPGLEASWDAQVEDANKWSNRVSRSSLKLQIESNE